MKFKVNDKVKKISGYKWPGVVVAAFTTTSGEDRYVVECTIAEVFGALHFNNENQLEIRDE